MATPTASRSSGAPWLWAVGTVLLVVVVAGAGLWLNGRAGATNAAPSASTQPVSATASDFYFHVKLIEARPQRQGGRRWDVGSDNAPDLCYRINYRGQEVYEAPERSDTLIAEWDLFSVDLRELVRNEGQADVSSLIAAPLVHREAGAKVVIDVFDHDTVGNDEVARVEIDLADLAGGERVLQGNATDDYARIVIQLIPRNTPVDELVELQRRR